MVSVLFSEPKIPQFERMVREILHIQVSVLFSEPKIPQFPAKSRTSNRVLEFQCSSASRKFLNYTTRAPNRGRCRTSFSALQRAENSSIWRVERQGQTKVAFQCSSASRKFLNRAPNSNEEQCCKFQCSSASRKFLNLCAYRLIAIAFRFQCSSASRKFLNPPDARARLRRQSAFQCSSASRKFLN